MKQIHILKGLLIMFAMLMTVQVAKADDYIYAFGAPLGKTTYEDYYRILRNNNYTFSSNDGKVAIFNGTFSGREAKIYLHLEEDGIVYSLSIRMSYINPMTAASLYADLLFDFMEKYSTFNYLREDEGLKTTAYFLSDAGSITLEKDSEISSSTIEIFFISQMGLNIYKEKKADKYNYIDSKAGMGFDDTFEPDFEIEVDSTLYPKDMNSLNVDWSVSDEFKTKSGKTGSYWFPTMRIICRADGKFLLTILRPASNGYFKVSEGDDCYIRLENDSIVTLKINTEYSPWNYEREGYYVGSVFMKKRYFTQTFYDIEDIMQLSNSDIVKIRWIEDNKPYDIEYTDKKWAKSFNKSFHDAIQQAYKKQKEKTAFNDNKLSGF